MSNTRNTFTLITLLLLGLGAVTATQNVRAQSDPFMDFFNKDCVPGAQKSGLTKTEAQQGCTCTVNTLKNKYTSNDFRNLLTKYRSGDAKAEQTLRSYGETCFDEVLEDILFED